MGEQLSHIGSAMNNDASNLSVTIFRGRTKSQLKGRADGATDKANSPLKRTSSDSDISVSRRSCSNTSQCGRSRANSRIRVNIDDLMDKSKRTSSEHGPRPNPIGMAFRDDEVQDDHSTFALAEISRNTSFSQSLDIEVELDNENKPKTDTGADKNRLEKERKRELAFLKLRSELDRAHQELRKRDEECKKLSRVRDDLDNEVEDLTASLFEEANKMVFDAKTKQASAEMQLKETSMKLDGVQAEVVALKLLVITSTPSNPGKKGHRRAPSADQICAECETCHSVTDGWQDDSFAIVKSLEEKEVDRLAYRDFVAWLEKHCPLAGHPFLEQLETEDVMPCLRFPNQEMSAEIHKAIITNSLELEAVTGVSKSRRCALTKSPVNCSFRVRVDGNGKWNFISNGSRTRIVAVANLYTYLRYISKGLIRKEVSAMYWEIIRKKGEMALARLGLSRDSYL